MRSKSVSFWAVIAALLAVAGVSAAYPVAMWHRFQADFWPVDSSRVGPNLTANAVQWFVIGVAMLLLYPPFRRFVTSELSHAHAKLDAAIKLSEHIIQHTKAVPSDHGVVIPAPGSKANPAPPPAQPPSKTS